MIKSLAVLLSAAVIAAVSRQQPVVITGTATDCIDLEVIKIRNMEVRALDPGNSNASSVLKKLGGDR